MSFKNKIVSVKVEKIVFPGRSLCRCSDGVALFAEGLLSDEIADVLVTKDKTTFREGLVKNLVARSAQRIAPACSSFGLCGGCSFQNTSYENQIKYKQEYISELLSFTGTEISKILPSPKIWRYRNKAEFSFFNNENTLDLGFHRKGSFNKYISVPPCFIVDDDFLQAVEIVKKFASENNIPAYDNRIHKGGVRHLVLRKAENNAQLLVNIVVNPAAYKPLFLDPLIRELSGSSTVVGSVYCTYNCRKSDAVLADKLTHIHGAPFITEKLNVGKRDYFFNISPFSFFQTNSRSAEILYDEILKILAPQGNEILLDLYCGTGAIGISIARNVKKVIGIEHVEQAVDNAKKNATINGIDNIEFHAATVENWVKESKKSFDVVVVDPPRVGLSKDVIKFLIGSKAKKIVYVSCNPSTLARDLRVIIYGGYKIKKITPVDMFPQTYHIEAAVLLESV